MSHWPGAAPRASDQGLDIHRVGSRHTYNLVAPRYYRRKLRVSPFDVFVEDLNKVPIFAPYWAGVPVALVVHHLFGATAFREASFPIAAATWLMERPLARVYRSTPVVAVSESTKNDLVARGFSPGQIRVIENGVDVSLYRPGASQARFPEPTVLYLGRLKRYKRIDLIVRAFAVLGRELPSARLVIAGTGDHAAALRSLVERLGLHGRVDFTGFVSEADKLRLLRGAWVHVLTSPKEGWGISNLEAASSGTATVASNSPGLRDSVRHGETGFLVPHGEVEALAAQIRTVLVNPTLRESLGLGARRFAEQLTWERSADHMEAFLAQIAQVRTTR